MINCNICYTVYIKKIKQRKKSVKKTAIFLEMWWKAHLYYLHLSLFTLASFLCLNLCIRKVEKDCQLLLLWNISYILASKILTSACQKCRKKICWMQGSVQISKAADSSRKSIKGQHFALRAKLCSQPLLLTLLLSPFSHVWLLATPWIAAYQAPPSMGFSRQEYWSGLPLPSLVHSL